MRFAGITAKVLARSKSSITGDILTTWELTYPRFILAELNTHRMLSKNSMSSRAVPFTKMIAQCRDNPAMPGHFGINQPGMQANGELQGALRDSAVWLWRKAAGVAAVRAEALDKLGIHKQVVNRLLEPFQTMKTVLSGTELDNFYWLRDHEDAQPEIRALAQAMKQAVKEFGEPVELLPGEWHTPYFGDGYWKQGNSSSLEAALAISASCCAQVSFRTTDGSLEKALKITEMLNLTGDVTKPCHASPVEHQGSPMQSERPFLLGEIGINHEDLFTWEKGITHIDRNGKHWSGNFKGFIQRRNLIPNNVIQGEK